MDRIIIDQAKIRIDADLVRRGAPPFPRPLTWWQKTTPVWMSVEELGEGRIALSPSGKVADGRQVELTTAAVRRYLKAIVKYLAGRTFLDFSDAIETE